MKKRMNKLGLSLIVSYVLLVSIAVALGAISYVFLKEYPSIIKEPVDCKDDTSITLVGYTNSSTELKLIIRNNGLFNVNGFMIAVGNITGRVPIEKLWSADGSPTNLTKGSYNFKNPLRPEESIQTIFVKEAGYDVKKIQLQPFIIGENGDQILCSKKVITQKVDASLTPIETCGDNIKDPGEDCDGSDFGASYDGTCVSYSSSVYSSGDLKCTFGCSISTVNCVLIGAPETCSDGVQNQGEIGIDCGGPCTACTTAPTCSDGIQNQGETGIDCGGPCTACSPAGAYIKFKTSNLNYPDTSQIYYNNGTCGINLTEYSRTNTWYNDAGVSCDNQLGAGNFLFSIPGIDMFTYSGKPLCSNLRLYKDGDFLNVCGNNGNYIGYKRFTKTANKISRFSTDSSKEISCTATCSDGIQNQYETGIDCGGPCTACAYVKFRTNDLTYDTSGSAIAYTTSTECNGLTNLEKFIGGAKINDAGTCSSTFSSAEGYVLVFSNIPGDISPYSGTTYLYKINSPSYGTYAWVCTYDASLGRHIYKKYTKDAGTISTDRLSIDPTKEVSC
ncbi:MAG: hypothetical protein WC438_00230 [Candidatus Pacearchaeota archaeon]